MKLVIDTGPLLDLTLLELDERRSAEGLRLPPHLTGSCLLIRNKADRDAFFRWATRARATVLSFGSLVELDKHGERIVHGRGNREFADVTNLRLFWSAARSVLERLRASELHSHAVSDIRPDRIARRKVVDAHIEAVLRADSDAELATVDSRLAGHCTSFVDEARLHHPGGPQPWLS